MRYCPSCAAKGDDVKTIDSRPRASGEYRRRMHCQKCGFRFTTSERLVGAQEADREEIELRLESALISLSTAIGEIRACQTLLKRDGYTKEM